MKKINLGDKVKDKYTELEGTAIARTEYINGCVQYQIMPNDLKDGKPVDDIWIDEVQLEVIENNKVDVYEPTYGGLRSHPIR